MPVLPRLLTGVLLVAGLAACTTAPPDGAASARPAAALTLAPGPTGAPVPTALDVPPPPGTVRRVAGPFDDRLALEGTRLAADGVHTRVTVLSDVSEVLSLELSAAFYDASGRLLGTGRAVRGEQSGQGVPDERTDLVVPAAPAWAPRVASAVLSVPVLVNE